MKKTVSILLILALALTLSIGAFAEEPATADITITSAVEGATYNAYMMFALESFDADNNHYSYKLADGWAGFFADGANAFCTLDDNGYLTAVDSTYDYAALAKAAIAYAEANSIAPAGTKTVAADETTVTFSDLPLGYYVIDSTVGSLVILDTNDEDLEIAEKNYPPIPDKEQTTPSVAIGFDVPYEVTITIGTGRATLTMRDTMTESLDFNNDVVVYLNEKSEDKLVDAANYTVSLAGDGDTFTFKVIFEDAYIQSLKAEDNLIVKYSAKVNEKAIVIISENEADLIYDNDLIVEGEPVDNELREFDLNKVDGETKSNLDGAEFKLYTDEECTKEVSLILVEDKDNGNYYRPIVSGETAADSIEVKDGNITVKGLAAGQYWLMETKQPKGYNRLKDPIAFDLTEGNCVGDKKIVVENLSGTELPSTGGVGTTLFYIIGGVLVVTAGVLLITKKRVDE